MSTITFLYLFLLAALMPSDNLEQYRITVMRGTESELVNADRTPTGWEFSDGSGVLIARAQTVSPLVYEGSLPGAVQLVDLKSYVPDLVVPLRGDRAAYATSDGGTLTVRRQGRVIAVELTAVEGMAVTIEPRGE